MSNITEWTPKDTLIALVVVIIWGLNFVPMKLGLEALSPLELGAGRYLFAALPLCFFVRFPRMRLRWVVLLGLFQGVAQFALLFTGLKIGMTAALASVVLQTQIYFTVLWSFLIYRQRPSKLLWLSMGAAAVGLLFFATSALQDGGTKAVTAVGILFTLGSAAMWGAANLVSRQAQYESPASNPLAFVVWSSVIAIGVYIVLVAWLTPDASRWLSFSAWQQLSGKTWLAVLYLSWLSTLAGYALWTSLFKRHTANKVAPFSLGVPVIGLLAGMILLGEPVDGWQWIGSACVGLSLLLVVFGGRWIREYKKTPEAQEAQSDRKNN